MLILGSTLIFAAIVFSLSRLAWLKYPSLPKPFMVGNAFTFSTVYAIALMVLIAV